MGKTNISWTEHTVNFYTWNCNKVSPGCKYCYAETLAKRYGKTFNGAPEWREKAVAEFMKLPKNAEAFINSMSDTFHEGAPEQFVRDIIGYAHFRPDVKLLILTKRTERAADMLTGWILPGNVYLGTSVESQAYVWRLEHLKRIEAGKFVSFEPLLGPIDADLTGIDGVIVGGESGQHLTGPQHPRWLRPEWARSVRELCARDGVKFFYKQSSGRYPGAQPTLDGQTYDELPWRIPAPVQATLF